MASIDSEEPTARRKSGRVTRKPDKYLEDDHSTSVLSNASNKRKRARVTNGSMDDRGLREASDSEDDADESDSDEDEAKEQRKRQRKHTPGPKATAKRSKTTNGASTTLAIRSASRSKNVGTKSAKAVKARSRPSAIHAGGLYAEVFGKGRQPQNVAGGWLEELQSDNVAGIRELVNFILQCVGCESRIESSDIEDIDNVPSRLGDILEEYSHQQNTDYGLLSKMKQSSGFKEALADFSNAVVHSLHSSGILYDEPAVYDNIHVWTATMSGATYRPFRHTATVVSLAMTTALCQIAHELQNSMATTKTQIEAEKKKKKGTNKARVTKLEEEAKREESRLERVDELLSDAFDTVYVHRYRDVDEKIRVECVMALGNWILVYRKMFLDPQYLRYLGWVLSDPNALTRLEVIKAWKAQYKHRGNVGALRAFTDRFRPRIVEIGSRDTDTGVRVEAIELLDRLRNAELLEPDDIDTVGQLIFDDEPRIRKAVAKFFVSNIEDLYKASVEEFDEEQFASALPTVEDADDFTDPCQPWIKFKCLAQTLAAHDEDKDRHNDGYRDQEVYGTEDTDSRYMLATQSIYAYMPELTHWECLAGFLLFDHSSIPAEADPSDVNRAVQLAYKLESGEDTVLLDVLQFCVKLYLQQVLESQTEHKSKKSKDEARQKQETAANHLTLIIPQLLSKFGSAPEAAASILRLEQLIDIDLINDLQSGEGTYVGILENINKQFNSHNDRKVLVEASKAFRAARSYESSQDAVDAKVTEIWTESKESLNSMLQNKNISARGTIDRTTLRGVADILSRLAQLAVVSDCTESLEGRLTTGGGRNSKGKSSSLDTLLDTLFRLLQRGTADEDTTAQFAELEDRICKSVLTILSFYFRWRVVALKNAISNKDTKSLSTGTLTNFAMQRSSFVDAVTPVISTRRPLDSLRVMSILTLLDLFTLFATIQHMRPTKGSLSGEIQSNLRSLSTDVSADIIKLVMETHEKMEKRLARKTKKRIELPLEDKIKGSGAKTRQNEDAPDDQEDVEAPPQDSDDENNASGSDGEDEELSEEDEHATGSKGREARKQAALVAEQALCELTSKLVLATIAGVINQDGRIKARLQVNRSRLGKSYGQVIAYLDEKKPKSKAKPGPKTEDEKRVEQLPKNPAGAQKTRNSLRARLSEAMVIEDDDIEDEENDQVEEGDEEDLRRRGLEDDAPEDQDEGEEQAAAAAAEEAHDNDDDDVMGD